MGRVANEAKVMRQRLIIWMPLLLLLIGCGQGSVAHTTTKSHQAAVPPPVSRAEISGMFGLRLGDKLPASLVNKIDGWREMAEVGAYCVTPPQRSDVFDSYTVQLLGGPICKITASRNGQGQALVNVYEGVMKELTAQFGPPTNTDALDARANRGVAWEQIRRSGGRVRMTLAMDKGLSSDSGYAIPGHVMLEIQQL